MTRRTRPRSNAAYSKNFSHHAVRINRPRRQSNSTLRHHTDHETARIADPSRSCTSDETTTPRRDHGADRLRPQKEDVRATEACRLCGRTQLNIPARQAAGATARQTRRTRTRRTSGGFGLLVHASLPKPSPGSPPLPRGLGFAGIMAGIVQIISTSLEAVVPQLISDFMDNRHYP